MRYRIQATNDDVYRRAESYAETHCTASVKVKLPERRVLSVENLSDSAIADLRGIGADVAPEFQWDLEGSSPYGID